MLANPEYVAVLMSKYNISDGFYFFDLNMEDIPKLGVDFPNTPSDDPLVALPLVLPMGWKNSQPIFSMVTETIANLTTQHINPPLGPKAHQLDDKAKAAYIPEVEKRPALSSSPNTTPNPFT